MGKRLIIKNADFHDSAIASALVITVSNGLVAITDANAVSIYYTLDGSIPTIHSTLYTEPFTYIQREMAIRAISVYSDGTISDIARYGNIITNDVVSQYIFDGIVVNGNTGDIVSGPSFKTLVMPVVKGREYLLCKESVSLKGEGNIICGGFYSAMPSVDNALTPTIPWTYSDKIANGDVSIIVPKGMTYLSLVVTVAEYVQKIGVNYDISDSIYIIYK